MRVPHLIPAVLSACLVMTAAAAGAHADPSPADTRVRLTGELVRTAVEQPGDRQWSAVRVDDRLVPVAGAALTETPANATVTLDVEAPQSVADAAAAGDPLVVEPGAEPLEVTRVVATRESRAASYTPATRRITYVEVTPRGMAREAVTSSAATTQVAASDTYWSDQSRGELRVGAPTIATRYTSRYSCDDDPFALWDEAIDRTGWTWRDNTSLVIKLPEAAGHECGYGLGSLGDDPNSPGVLHVADTAAPVLAHELGHNMGFDHANALVCSDRSDAALAPATEGWSRCDEAAYGDSLDIMGPSSRTDTPMLSTPQALRHGLLPVSAAKQVGVGTTRVTLQPLSGLEGVRAAVTKDSVTGVTYWVEYRTPTGRDATNPTRQDTGVRVLRTTPWSGSVVLDPTPSGTRDNRVALAPGQFVKSYDGRIRVTTESVTPTAAVVRISNTDRLWTLGVTSAPRVSGTRGVGKQVTALRGTWSPAPTTYTYRWRRSGGYIPGATGKTYTLTRADAGRWVSVEVTGKRQGYATSAVRSAGVGVPIHATKPPSVRGTHRSGSTLTVDVGTWTPKPTSYGYQWYRDGVAIKGRTARTYTLTTQDKGKLIRARVTARRSGYSSGVRWTPRQRVAR